MSSCDFRIQLRDCDFEDVMRLYYMYELVAYSFLTLMTFVHFLQFWTRAPWSSVHVLVGLGCSVATTRLLFVVYLNFFEADTPYAAEIIWMAFWCPAAAFVLYAALVWLGVAERASAALSGTKLASSRLLELGGTKLIRNFNRFLQLWLVFIALPLLLTADGLRAKPRDSAADFQHGTVVLRAIVGLTGVVACAGAGTAVVWAGASLHRDLSQSFERIKSSLPPQQQVKQVHTMRVLFGITSVLGAIAYLVSLLFLVYSVWFHQVSRHFGPVVWSLLLFGQIPVVTVINHLLLEAPEHDSVGVPRKTASPFSVQKVKFRISAFLNLFPPPPRVTLLNTRVGTVTMTATVTATQTETMSAADVDAPAEPVAWQRPLPVPDTPL